jgi:membrane-anchored glycerophosphoryl diester phosphodiesterase (GDPDase)
LEYVQLLVRPPSWLYLGVALILILLLLYTGLSLLLIGLDGYVGITQAGLLRLLPYVEG